MKSMARLVAGDGPYDPIDWREFHFFKPNEGIARNDLLEIRICLDYEQARESPGVIEFVSNNDAHAKARSIKSAIQMRTRFAPVNYEGGDEEEKAANRLTVPAACLAASWFPKPWLSATKEARRAVISLLEAIYSQRPLPCWTYPMEFEEATLLTATAEQENQLLYVIAIDKSQPVTKLVDAFRNLLGEIGIRGDNTRRGKIKFASALEDLGCYRLARLKFMARSDSMLAASFRRSANKISDGKRRAIARLRGLGHIELSTE
jgi:hypothetical protein